MKLTDAKEHTYVVRDRAGGLFVWCRDGKELSTTLQFFNENGLDLIRVIPGMLEDAKRREVEALGELRLSRDEYRDRVRIILA
jgi:hypothetical protein